VREACKKHKGFFSARRWTGGRAWRRLHQKVEIIEFRARHGSDLAHRVVDFPAFIVIDDKGNDFFAKLG